MRKTRGIVTKEVALIPTTIQQASELPEPYLLARIAARAPGGTALFRRRSCWVILGTPEDSCFLV